MRKKLVYLLEGLLFCAILCGIAGLEEYIKNTHTKEAIVIDCQDNVCIAKDIQGNVWKFNKEECEIGSKVKLYINANNTDFNISDDAITKIKIIEGE